MGDGLPADNSTIYSSGTLHFARCIYHNLKLNEMYLSLF